MADVIAVNHMGDEDVVAFPRWFRRRWHGLVIDSEPTLIVAIIMWHISNIKPIGGW